MHSSDRRNWNDEWYTPAVFIEKAREAMGSIDLDPASCARAQETVQATTFYTKEDDGLTKPWFGNVFSNPPYSRPLLQHFSKKLLAELSAGNVKQAIYLIRPLTCSLWYHDLAAACTAKCEVKRRMVFYGPSGVSSPTSGHQLLYFGLSPWSFVNAYKDVGWAWLPAANETTG